MTATDTEPVGHPSTTAGDSPLEVLAAASGEATTGGPAPKLSLRDRIRPREFLGGWPALPLYILFGFNLVDELDRVAFNILAPEIQDDFGLSLTTLTSLVALIAFFALAGAVVIGYIADRGSRVKTAVGGAAVWALFTFLTGAAPAIVVLTLARIGSSLGKAVVDPTHSSLLADYYPPDRRIPAYGFHRAANNVGQILAPAGVGILSGVLGLSWRVPFLLFAIPTALLVFVALTRLREPERGAHERRAAGGTGDEQIGEERKVSVKEAWRACHRIKTLRRIWLSLPFLGVGLGGFAFFYNLLYEEVFGLSVGQRSVIALVAEPFQLVGVIIGIPIASRLYRRGPGNVMKMVFGTTAIVCVSVTIFALAPTWPIAMFFHVITSVSIVSLVPALYATTSLTIPPRVRTLGFAFGAVYLIPSAVAFVLVGLVGDALGIRAGVLVLVPILLVGGLVYASAGQFVEGDMQRVAENELARAAGRSLDELGASNLLVVRGLDVSYDQTQVLFGVDLDVREGEILALLGTNGAGKSTLLKAISGLNPATAGTVLFDGDDITGSDPGDTARRGIAQVPGGRGVFPSLTVADNIRSAGWLYRKDPAYLKQATARVLEYFPVLEKRWDTAAGSLSGGEQQMLSLAQAFIAKPKLLMIDELSLGLAPTVVERLLDIVRAIHANGTTIILVEQSVNVALRLAKRAVFMEKGEVRFSGPTEELLERGDILRAVFLKGADAGTDGHAGNGHARGQLRGYARRKDIKRRADLLNRPVVLETAGLTKHYGGVTAVNSVDLQLHQGQILGLIGPNGAGKTSIFDLISGFSKPDHGRIVLGGREVTDWPAWKRAEAGLARSFQDARLWPSLTVSEAISTSLKKQAEMTNPLPAMFGLPIVKDSEAAIADKVEELVDLLALHAFRDKFVSELSTGSRRMVEIATLLAADPDVVVLDEPSSGIAQKETEALGPVLREVQRYTGCSILIIEHDMPLISALADHIVALELGSVIAFGTPDEVLNHPRVIESYLGNTAFEGLQGSSGANGSARRRPTT